MCEWTSHATVHMYRSEQLWEVGSHLPPSFCYCSIYIRLTDFKLVSPLLSHRRSVGFQVGITASGFLRGFWGSCFHTWTARTSFPTEPTPSPDKYFSCVCLVFLLWWWFWYICFEIGPFSVALVCVDQSSLVLMDLQRLTCFCLPIAGIMCNAVYVVCVCV